MSNLVEHARRELELIGEDPEFTEGLLKVVQAFADMGHSGGSAMIAVPRLAKLLSFEALSPLTDSEDEWIHHEEDVWGAPGGIWQNKRDSRMFSTDAGTTYYNVDEKGTPEERVYQSSKKLEDGSVFNFPDGFFGILQKVIGEDDGAPNITDKDIRIIAWGGTPDKWLVQFDVPTMSTENFFDLVYDGEDDITGIRTYEYPKEDDDRHR